MVKWGKFSVEERQDQDIGYRGKKPRGNILLAYNFFILFSQHFMQNSKIQTIETSKWI